MNLSLVMMDAMVVRKSAYTISDLQGLKFSEALRKAAVQYVGKSCLGTEREPQYGDVDWAAYPEVLVEMASAIAGAEYRLKIGRFAYLSNSNDAENAKEAG